MKRTAWWKDVDNRFDNGEIYLGHFLDVLRDAGVLVNNVKVDVAVERAAAHLAREAVANPKKFRKTVARFLRWALYEQNRADEQNVANQVSRQDHPDWVMEEETRGFGYPRL